MPTCRQIDDIVKIEKEKMKKLTFVFLTTVLLGMFQTSPAQAEVCSTGTYTVGGINTFGDLPCKDPLTEINVTVRGLHDYGVSGGPTAYCSWNYVRRNLGTTTSPNWSASQNTVCDPKPAPVVAVTPAPTATPAPTPEPTPAPTPVVTPSPEPTASQTNNSGSTTSNSGSTNSSSSQPLVTQTSANTNNSTINSSNLGGFAIVSQNGTVYDVITAKISDFGNNDKILQAEYNGCPIGCRVIWQTQSDSNGNIPKYTSGGSVNVTYNDVQKTFSIEENGVVVSKVAAPEVTQTQNSNVTTSIEALFFSSSNNNSQELNSVLLFGTSNTETDNSNITVKEGLVVDRKVTEQEATTIISESSSSIMRSKIDRILRLLGDWFL
jgi:hypothetical protein